MSMIEVKFNDTLITVEKQNELNKYIICFLFAFHWQQEVVLYHFIRENKLISKSYRFAFVMYTKIVVWLVLFIPPLER